MRPTKQQDYQVITVKSPERIVKKQKLNQQTQYLIKWKGQEETTWEPEDNLSKALIDEFNLQIAARHEASILQRQMATTHKAANLSTELVQSKQREMTNKLCNAYPQKSDEIDTIALKIADDQCIFEVKWKQRSDSTSPLPEFYQYDQFKLIAPLLFIRYMEAVLYQSPESENIRFLPPSPDRLESAKLFKQILLKQFKFQDCCPKLPEEEQKQNQQPSGDEVALQEIEGIERIERINNTPPIDGEGEGEEPRSFSLSQGKD